MERQHRPIDKEFEEADYTGVLNLSGRNLRHFPNFTDDYCDPVEVFEADTSGNRFDKFPTQLFRCRNLVKLSLYNNLIRKIPGEFNCLTLLRHLDLGRNFIAKLPESICGMRLESLAVNNNSLSELPSDIGRMQHLRLLDASCNYLEALSPTLTQLANLAHLNLHRNHLKELPNDLHNVPLNHLDVSANLLRTLPVCLRKMTALSQFNCSDNPLIMPPALVCMRGLIHIFKHLQEMEKYGSDPAMFYAGRGESLMRRQREKTVRSSRPTSDASTSSSSSGDMSLTDAMTNYMYGIEPKPPRQSKPKMDLEAAQKRYMEQELKKSSPSLTRSQSPSVVSSSSQPYMTTQTTAHYGTLPRTSSAEDSSKATHSGRSLPDESYRRPGSWDSHHHHRVNNSSIPTKLTIPDSGKMKAPSNPDLTSVGSDDTLTPRSSMSIPSDEFVGSQSDTTPPRSAQAQITQDSSPKLPHTERDELRSGSPPSRDGSITPTNEEEAAEEQSTPKSKQLVEEVFILDSEPQPPRYPSKQVSFSAEISQIPRGTPSVSSTESGAHSREGTPSVDVESETSNREGSSEPFSPTRGPKPEKLPKPSHLKNRDKTWPRTHAPTKEKEVFKMIRSSRDMTNYTVRRLEISMKEELKKADGVKKEIEELMDVKLDDDLGVSVSDGVLLCQLVNKLHPTTIANVHIPRQGESLSKPKRTINVASFIAACKKLGVEEVCSAGEILEFKDPSKVITCIRGLLDTVSV